MQNRLPPTPPRQSPDSPASSKAGGKLPRMAEKAIGALLAHPTILAASKAIGVNERTLRDWLTQPAFQAAYAKARKAIIDQALASLQAGLIDASESLRRIATNPVADERAQV